MTEYENERPTTQNKYVTPRVGTLSATGFVIIGLVTWAIHRNFSNQISSEWTPSNPSYLIHWIWLSGIIYGLATGACWIATIVQARYWRWVLRTAFVTSLALLRFKLDQVNEPSLLREFINLGSVCLCQSILFFWLRVPNWEIGNVETDPTQRSQYGTGDILIITTVVAVLLAFAIRFPPPIDQLSYWPVRIAGWVIEPLIAAMIALGVLSRKKALAKIVGAIVLASTLVAGLSAAEMTLTNANPDHIQYYFLFYANMVVAFVSTICLLSIAGCLQGSLPPTATLDS